MENFDISHIKHRNYLSNSKKYYNSYDVYTFKKLCIGRSTNQQSNNENATKKVKWTKQNILQLQYQKRCDAVTLL